MTTAAGASRFSELRPETRVAAVLDDASFGSSGGSGSVILGRGRIDGRDIRIAATDPAAARGAIGVAECRGLSALLAQARTERTPVVLLLDSSGARVDEGLPALGAFRGLLREILLARLAGLPMLAVVGRACFGGASLLACACSRRSYLAGARLAASGPAVVEAAVGTARFDARDPAAIDALMGSVARTDIDAQGMMVMDAAPAVGDTVRAWMREVRGETWSPHGEHAALGTRLRAAGLAVRPSAPDNGMAARLAGILPDGCRPQVAGDAFHALPTALRGPAFLGALSGAPVGAATCWQLAEWLLTLHREHPGSPVVLLLDADGHAATVTDEQVLLSAYLVHLSLTLGWVSAAGHRSVLWLPGRASGASYVAFAAPVAAVSALPSAQIEILPAAAARQIVKTAQTAVQDPAAVLRSGVADAWLDERLRRRADPSG